MTPARPGVPSTDRRPGQSDRHGPAAWAASPRVRAALLGFALVLALVAGLALRAKVWRATEPIRYSGDLASAYYMGIRANQAGYLRFYDDVRDREDGLAADYAPLRLLVATTWIRWLRTTYPAAPHDGWRRQYVKPLLRLNLVAELLTAVGVFLLVRRWTRRAERGAPGSEPTLAAGGRAPPRTLPALAAALLFWFDPAVIWNAHAYPQWDTWLLPFFVFALLAASAGWWFCAGALVAMGAMIKGQILLVAPVFLAWPLFARDGRAALRWIAGFAAAGTLLVSPWLVPSWTATLWIASILGAWILLAAIRKRGARWWVIAAVVALVTLLPWVLTSGVAVLWSLAGALALVGAARAARTAPRAVVAALLLAATLLVAGLAFHGSFGWYHAGFARRVAAVDDLRKPSVSNLGTILSRRWGWRGRDALWDGARAGGVPAPTLRSTLAIVYAATLLLCGLAAARHATRQDPRFLLAVTAPWVLMFALLPGMHQRYLVWGSGLTAMGAVIGAVPAGIHLVVALIGWAMMAHTQLALQPGAAPGLLRALGRLYPDAGGGAVLGCGALLLLLALRPRRRGEAADVAPTAALRATGPAGSTPATPRFPAPPGAPPGTPPS